MNKKLFIFMFLVMANPVFANDNPFRDEVINELPPTLTEVKTTEAKTPFVEKVKNIDVNTLTPIEALTKLFELQKEAENL